MNSPLKKPVKRILEIKHPPHPPFTVLIRELASAQVRVSLIRHLRPLLRALCGETIFQVAKNLIVFHAQITIMCSRVIPSRLFGNQTRSQNETSALQLRANSSIAGFFRTFRIVRLSRAKLSDSSNPRIESHRRYPKPWGRVLGAFEFAWPNRRPAQPQVLPHFAPPQRIMSQPRGLIQALVI